MDLGQGHGQAVLVEGEVQFDATDVALLRAIDTRGSVIRASEELGRSRARALRRIQTLEEAFGTLVERKRGGRDGGGSRITPDARELIDRYERVAAAVRASASVRETVLYGKVRDIEGELAEVETDVGTIRGRHDGLEVDDSVQVRIAADAITVQGGKRDLDPDDTSARNHRVGELIQFGEGETVRTVNIACDGVQFVALLTEESRRRLGISPGDLVTLSWKATATALIETNQFHA